jgi:predicted outer membrane protein
MMKTRTLFAGTLIAGLVTAGTGAAAFAQSTQPTTPARTKAHHDKFCDTWVPRLPGLDANIDRDNHQIDALNQAIQVARAHHHEDVAERLERQRDKVQRERDRDVILVAGIHLRCGV